MHNTINFGRSKTHCTKNKLKYSYESFVTSVDQISKRLQQVVDADKGYIE